MARWKTAWEAKKVLVTDGAWGTQLALKGLAAGTVPEIWNMERPGEVSGVARSYVEAGSDIILTNTFGGHPFKLGKSNLRERTQDLNRRGVEISKEAAGPSALVFASIGPSGEFMEPLGEISEPDMVKAYMTQIQACVSGGADGLLFETFTDLTEASAAIRAACECCDLPVAASMTFDKGAQGFATMMGVRPDRAAGTLQAAGASIVGANCGAGIEDMVHVMGLMRPETDLPLWAKANAGLPELVEGKTVYRETPEEMASHLEALLKAGASHVGGCCGTTPDHIRLLAERVRRIRKA